MADVDDRKRACVRVTLFDRDRLVRCRRLLLWHGSLNWKYLMLGFILFRGFDIWKPFPVRQAESLPGGWGIMADDWAAAIYAAAGLWIARWLGSDELRFPSSPSGLRLRREFRTSAPSQHQSLRTEPKVPGNPRIEQVKPAAAIPGGEVTISGSGFGGRNHHRPQVRFGTAEANLIMAAENVSDRAGSGRRRGRSGADQAGDC